MCQREFVIRAVGHKTDRGWAIKTVLNRQSDAERFHGHWLPEAENHHGEPYGRRSS